MKLKNLKVLITGACGRIGSACVLDLLKNGAKVILSDISQEKLNKLSNELIDKDLKDFYAINADITTSRGICLLIKEASNNLENINAAIHCAYPTSPGWGEKFEDLKEENLFLDLNMQLGSAILFSKYILEYFKERKKGHLIHVSSVQGISAPKFSHYENTNMTSPIEYSAIKAGTISITRWLAKYYKNTGLRINCVSPGGIKNLQPESFIKKYRESCSNIGMLNSEDISSVIRFLLSEDSYAINGQNLIIDDGWSL